MQRFMISTAIAASTILFTAGVALAGTTTAPTTKTTGQPSQSCEATGGFFSPLDRPGNSFYAPGSPFNDVNGVAGPLYAGNGQNTKTPASPNAVSQYDVACANQVKVP
jgi:hypothetical protein